MREVNHQHIISIKIYHINSRCKCESPDSVSFFINPIFLAPKRISSHSYFIILTLATLSLTSTPATSSHLVAPAMLDDPNDYFDKPSNHAPWMDNFVLMAASNDCNTVTKAKRVRIYLRGVQRWCLKP